MGIFDLFRKRSSKGEGEKDVSPVKEVAPTKDVSSAKDVTSQVMDKALREFVERKDHHYSIIAKEYKTFDELLALPDKQKVNFIIRAVKVIGSGDRREDRAPAVADAFMSHLIKTKLILDDDDLSRICSAFSEKRKDSYSTILHWPIPLFVIQIERNTKDRPLSDQTRSMLKVMKGAVMAVDTYYDQKARAKIIEKLDALLFEGGNNEEAVRPVYFQDDVFGKYANGTLDAIEEKERGHWFQLMALTQKTSGGKPTKKFLDAGGEILSRMGHDQFKRLVNEWFTFIVKLSETSEEHTYNFTGTAYTHTSYEFINTVNSDLIKGFVWLCCHLNDSSLLVTIAALAERCYKKIPGKGPAAAGIGNACFYTLANTDGLEGVGHLSRLKLKVKQSNTEALIGKYLQEAAKDHGVTVHEVEDMAADDFGLVEGKREYSFDDYTAVLAITGVGKTELSWYKPDGKPQKSVPAFVKEKYGDQLKEIKDTVKQVEVNLTSQRDRIDRMFKAKRELNGAKFNEYYFSHGLLSYLAKGLIWNIGAGDKVVPAFYLDGKWVNAASEPVEVSFNSNVSFSLWHPVQSTIEEVKAWREFFLDKSIVQPLKQAFREVYLLTDAEINTRVYSNRMAAHILKQHQFNSLAKTRGWKYSLLGAYDDGRENETASITIPDYQLRAEYWINEVNAENAMNDTGIWLYVATDQVRFLKQDSSEIVELIDVPAIVLSEVMRDVDLFVGVASVGNDPMWRDGGGLPAYRDYWQGYSFGELTEVAKTRKQILQRLLPRLKIARVAEIKDRFLVVKGKLRTYKIHLGSTNILMEPNDQYLCIVPDRSPKGGTEHVFLPFEGDNGLSIIISKAFLLAEDDKITDSTITRQINTVAG